MRRAVASWVWAAFTLPTALPALPGRLLAVVGAERERWLLWLPVGVGAGVALYLALPWEPPARAGPLVVAFSLALAVLWRRRGILLALAAALGIVAVGFTLVQLRGALIAAPVIESRLGPTTVIGRIADVEATTKGQRVQLENLWIGGLPAAATPGRLRLTIRKSTFPLRAGDTIRLRAIVQPPPPPAAPGAYDFQRRSYFAGLGGVGFALGAPARNDRPAGATGRLDRARFALDRLRQDLATRIRAQLSPAAGALAAAFMTGERGAIPEEIVGALRDSGLAHLLAISGLHMGLLAGFVFFGARALFALSPWLALNRPIKKWAAALAIVAAAAYLVLSGASIPTQRAFIMTGIVLLAVLLERRALSMRSVAWAAAVVLVIQPESVADVGFQMSFAAVVALIATYETWSGRLAGMLRGESLVRRVAAYFLGIAATTLIAGLATGLIAVFHFNRVTDYALIANLAAIPLMGLWIMPWAVVAFVLLPFGLEWLALAPMAAGIALLVDIATWVAGLPGAIRLVPAGSPGGLVAVIAGGLWLCLWRRPWRRLGWLAIAGGLIALALARGPDILIDGEARLLAVRDADGRLILSSRRTARFTGETWLRLAGQDRAADWPRQGASDGGRLRCDAVGCAWRKDGWLVALPFDERALAEDCRRADVVVSTVPVRGRCPSARIVIDRFDVWRNGAHAVWLNADGSLKRASVNEYRGDRPWVIKRGRAAPNTAE